ncbi:TPR domain-containing protein [Photobacterium nomapromontoriensis]|uniref:TPR domain-containing protein n=1 Tax=Photobacterium nomapromontoriensis TaxID=2910237 RepID=UPI003D14544C
MQYILFSLLLGVAVAGLLWYAYQARKCSSRQVWGISIAVCLFSLFAYGWLGTPIASEMSSIKAELDTSDTTDVVMDELGSQATPLQIRIDNLQNQLRKDTQNGELWYALGNAYMYENAFDKAQIAFSYALRLAPEPQTNIYTALATSSYYQQGQRFTPESQAWLEKALQLDADNISALMLLASDYFLTAHYQKAIDTWQRALDTERSDLDRVAIINAINQAKGLL